MNNALDLVPAWFKDLYDKTGINFTIFYDGYDFHRYASGVGMTLVLSAVSILASVIIGAAGAAALGSRAAWLRGVTRTFVVVFRNTPPLVQIFFFYFGIGSVLPSVATSYGTRPLVGNVAWAAIALSLFAGAFNVEIFRSGIEAVPKTTTEAAEALGYTRLGAYRHVVLPLAFRVCLPALNNNLINLVKTTTLAFAIAVPEALYAANQIWSESQNVLEMMCVLLATYLTIVGGLAWLVRRWERRLRIPGVHR